MRLSDRATGLGQVLDRWRPIWEARPYLALPVPWEAAHPELADWLRALPAESVEAYERTGSAPIPPHLAPWRAAVAELTHLPSFDPGELPVSPELRRGMSPRKWSQIAALAGCAVRAAEGADSWLDWCAGKGHLGRTLAVLDGRPAHLVELRAELCASGAQRAAVLGADCTFHQADALSADGAAHLSAGRFAVGLHACGQLSDALLRVAVARGAAGLAVSPCCPHNIVGDTWTAWSTESPPRLDATALRLATAEEVTATQSRRKLRIREMEYRWAVDLLRREADGASSYRSLTPCRRPWFRGTFEAFVDSAQREHHLRLPAGWTAAPVLERARLHVHTARALALARADFRRAMEVFVWADRAAWLADQGYATRLGTFIARQYTPRNLLLVAQRC
ncbi:MAG: hypothetical protein ACI9K2_000413 [Myxococcota bacterium]